MSSSSPSEDETSHYELMASFHDLPFFLPAENLIKVFWLMVYSNLALTVMFDVFRTLLKSRVPNVEARNKMAYQMNNFFVNLALGVIGTYHFMQLPWGGPYPLREAMTGMFEHTYQVCGIQLGYQFWAIPIGIGLVGEKMEMLVHHLAVLITSNMATNFTLGFRYYAPFMFGTLELSSLPLAVMNAFKDNPEWIKKYPGTYSNIRIFFAVTFLWIRWVLYLPRKAFFLYWMFLSLITASEIGYWVYYGLVFASSSFLMFLQVYWGILIIKGFIKLLAKRKKGKKQKPE